MTMTIHLNTDLTLETRYKIKQTASLLYDQADRLYAMMTMMDWQSTSREAFMTEVHERITKIKELADALDLLGFKLSQEMDQWLEVSSHFSS